MHVYDNKKAIEKNKKNTLLQKNTRDQIKKIKLNDQMYNFANYKSIIINSILIS